MGNGSNGYGQLGDGEGSTSRKTYPVQVKNTNGTELSGVIGVSGGDFHTVYLKSDGTVWATGWNNSGQLGDGSTTNRSNPVLVKNTDGTGLSGVIGVSGGIGQTVYLKSDGTLWATGWNHRGQLGDGTTTDRSNPVLVKESTSSELSRILKISSGGYHTVYLKSDGTVWAAGYNGNGQLGDGPSELYENRSNPIQVKNGDGSVFNGVVAVSAGSRIRYT